MAYQVIGSYDIYNFEQEEVVDKQLIAGEDGVVNEVEVLIQPYVKIQSKLIVSQDLDAANNKSKIKAELFGYFTAGEKGDGFRINLPVNDIVDGTSYKYFSYVSLDDRICGDKKETSEYYTINPSETKEIKITDLRLDDTYTYIYFNSTKREVGLYHDLDGSLNKLLFYEDYRTSPGYSNKQDKVSDFYYDFSELPLIGKFYFKIYDTILEGETLGTYGKTISQVFEIPFPERLVNNSRAIIPITANNFTDEENPTFTYLAEAQYCCVYNSDKEDYWNSQDSIVSLQAALSFDGITPDIAYRDIPIDGSNYTFVLTDAEKEVLQLKAQGSINVPIYYLTKVERTYVDGESGGAQSEVFTNSTQRILTITSCNPTVSPTVVDIKPETLALTGDENSVVRYESMVEYAINAVASKQATIISQSVQCGSKIIEGLPQGIIDDVESGLFVFKATDSRNLTAETAIQKNLIEYVKPTCYQNLEVELSGEVGAKIKLTVNGNYYNGSFGAVDNELKLEVRHTQNDGTMGDWVELTDGLIPTFNGNTYELDITISGFDYSQAYTFQCRATDKLNFVESSSYTIRLLPVFDWSETDFNFNVPVNMHGQTVLRHNETANNTVLSASGGHIYIRPNGTDDTTGETIIYPDGSIKFGGAIDLSETMADYVVETGTEEMGSNGTWYWTKWASGKAECYGQRNFGTMAITTSWGSLYRSEALTQDLPSGLFKNIPEAIHINLIDSNYGGWIAKHETAAPSTVSTGSFIVVRPANATITPSNIGFSVVGRWK